MHILRKEFKIGDKVLLFTSRFKLFLAKLKSKWSGLFEVVKSNDNGSVEIKASNGEPSMVNGQRIKYYFIGETISTLPKISLST